MFGGHFEKVTFGGGPYVCSEIEAGLGQSFSTNICCGKLEEISDLKIFSECFSGPLETLWRATFGLRAAIFPPFF